MPATVEREVKLRFDSPEAARAAVVGAGATPLHARRLQEDALIDTEDGMLRSRRCALRVRIESGHSFVTYKGPVQPSRTKVREELETPVGDGTLLLRIFEAVGFRVWFRYQKYREEFALGDVIVAVDETPVGTFIEVEGREEGIAAAAEALGRRPADYVLDSYRSLYLQHCQAHGLTATEMLFEED